MLKQSIRPLVGKRGRFSWNVRGRFIRFNPECRFTILRPVRVGGFEGLGEFVYRASSRLAQSGKRLAKDAKMCALVQVALKPECSFVLHTKHPLTESDQDMYAEMALGLGETLASGNVRGTPWRFDIVKATKRVTVKTFSSFGEMYIADESNSDSSVTNETRLLRRRQPLAHRDEKRRNDVVGTKLGCLGIFLESALGDVPQDIEGCLLSDGTICVVKRDRNRKMARHVPPFTRYYHYLIRDYTYIAARSHKATLFKRRPTLLTLPSPLSNPSLRNSFSSSVIFSPNFFSAATISSFLVPTRLPFFVSNDRVSVLVRCFATGLAVRLYLSRRT